MSMLVHPQSPARGGNILIFSENINAIYWVFGQTLKRAICILYQEYQGYEKCLGLFVDIYINVYLRLYFYFKLLFLNFKYIVKIINYIFIYNHFKIKNYYLLIIFHYIIEIKKPLIFILLTNILYSYKKYLIY